MTYNFQKSVGKVIFFKLQQAVHIVIIDILVSNNHVRAENCIVFP